MIYFHLPRNICNIMSLEEIQLDLEEAEEDAIQQVQYGCTSVKYCLSIYVVLVIGLLDLLSIIIFKLDNKQMTLLMHEIFNDCRK